MHPRRDRTTRLPTGYMYMYMYMLYTVQLNSCVRPTVYSLAVATVGPCTTTLRGRSLQPTVVDGRPTPQADVIVPRTRSWPRVDMNQMRSTAAVAS